MCSEGVVRVDGWLGMAPSGPTQQRLVFMLLELLAVVSGLFVVASLSFI